jgi:outer membrane receptor protein involved in Fe transport
MKFVSRFIVLAAIAALLATPIVAQISGTLAGTVTQDGVPLPGVTVTITSPNLQGSRTAVTNEGGGYNFPALPPGDYTVRYELEGMQTVTRRINVALAQNARLDAALQMSTVTEAITVTAAAPAVAETQEIQTTFQHETIEDLPVGRTIVAITNLAPGVSANGVNGLQISGSMSYDNLYTVNGVVIQENLRGQPENLFIEDAIQETTIQTGAISAEFGNFTGGVVNAITRSGSNEFSGSLRDSLTNPSWTADGPTFYSLSGSTVVGNRHPDQVNATNHVYEGTFNGRILRDRLWFATAGRYAKTTGQGAFTNANGTFQTSNKNERRELRLTGAITASHNLVGSYLESPTERTNDCQLTCFDSSALDPAVENPNTLKSAFYTGILTQNFVVEAKWAKRDFAFVGYGGELTDRITGTPVRLNQSGFGATVTNHYYFCGSCGDEIRDSDSRGLKTTYFLGTKSFGNHNFVLGAERYHETRLANNYQSSSGYVAILNQLDNATIGSGFTPRYDPATGQVTLGVRGGLDYIQYREINQPSIGSDLTTDALYFNNRWDLNSRWSFNLGARYDRNDSGDSQGQQIANDSEISPRLGVTFDPLANGRFNVRASYGTYVGRLAETVANSGSAAGNSERYDIRYNGPNITNVTPQEALRQMFAWYDSMGGISKNNPNLPYFAFSIPGASTQIRESLTSPSVDEITLGGSMAFNRGFVRLDYITREWKNFYDIALNLDTGRITLPSGAVVDVGLVTNNDEYLERNYNAIELQTQFRPIARLSLGTNYTWSRLESNSAGESSGGGPFSFGSPHIYKPEYYDWPGRENAPVGPADLEDQTHRLRAWASFDVPSRIGNWNFSLLERYETGRAYGLFGSIDIRESATFYGTGRPGGVANPGYLTASVPTSVTYWFEAPGERRFEDFAATDLAVNYNTDPSWLRGFSIFVQGEVTNVFNAHAQTGGNRAVITALTDSSLQRFNPFVDEPVEGVHWRKGPLFGLPTAATTGTVAGSYQTPRTYRVSLGVRF